MPPSARDRSQPAPNEDLEWCHATVQDVSRTFALTIEILDEPMSSQICVGYLLCRIPDTIEDAPHIPPADQVELLRMYEAVLDEGDGTTAEEFVAAAEPWIPDGGERAADWGVVAEMPRVLRAFERQPDAVKEAIRPPARELVGGMALFVDRYAEEGGLRIQSRDELRTYCHYAAGTVGELITNLVCRGDVSQATERRLYDTAESFGQLLQLVNIAKDVYDDFHRENNVYLPAADLRSEDVPQEDLCAADNERGTAAVVERTAASAREFLDDAQAYLEALPEAEGNRVAAWSVPYLLAVGTLRELAARPADALSEEGVKVSREEVQAIVAAALSDAGHDDRDLAELRATIASQPFHRA